MRMTRDSIPERQRSVQTGGHSQVRTDPTFHLPLYDNQAKTKSLLSLQTSFQALEENIFFLRQLFSDFKKFLPAERSASALLVCSENRLAPISGPAATIPVFAVRSCESSAV